MLAQVQEGGERVIAYASKHLNAAQRNYSTTERECLSIVVWVKRFHPYLHGSQFTVVTDHHSLKWLFSIKEPQARLARWGLALQEYNFDIQHRAGSKHQNADAMTRPPVQPSSDDNFAVTDS